MIPKIEIYSDNIKAKYDVSEDVCFEVCRVILKRIEENLAKQRDWGVETMINDEDGVFQFIIILTLIIMIFIFYVVFSWL